ncbi:unnamed protein product, partial [Brassica oleracea var. botrytis]
FFSFKLTPSFGQAMCCLQESRIMDLSVHMIHQDPNCSYSSIHPVFSRKEYLPEDNVSAESYYEIQKLVYSLGLPSEMIDYIDPNQGIARCLRIIGLKVTTFLTYNREKRSPRRSLSNTWSGSLVMRRNQVG